jgi:hypothetical protein
MFELARRTNTTRQLVFVTDPDDTYHMHRRAMLCTMGKLSPIRNVVAAYYDHSYHLTEEI